MATVNEKMTAIADNIRNYTKVTEKLSLDDMAESIEEVYKAGQESGGGYDEGYEAGQQAEYDRFWESYQAKTSDGSFRFAGRGWNNETFKPKKNINFETCYMLFRMSDIEGDLVQILSDCGVTLSTANASTIIYAFSYTKFTRIGEVDITKSWSHNSLFEGSTNLKTIDKLIVNEDKTFPSVFSGCTALENITFEGVIGNDISFKDSPLLTHDSLMNTISALKDFRTTQSYDCSFKTWQQEYMESFMAAFQSFDYDKFFKCDYEAGTMFILLPEADNYVGISFDEPSQFPSELQAELNSAVECAFNESGESITLKFPTTTETRTLTLGEANIKKLTESEKLSITEKGWILA